MVGAEQTIVISTECGLIQGIKDKSYVFKGIPYALPPVRNRRWNQPIPVSREVGTCWQRIYPALKFGNTCAQKNPLNESLTLGSEDCLYLNVWTPTVTKSDKLPVMVYIHGGSLQFANGNWPTYCPTESLAMETDIVHVSFNYRLHAFGFMALDILSAASGTKTSGNYGFMDQLAALQWVKANIENFGGDPNKITLYGQSSGGTSVFALLASPFSNGLFQRAWMLSASPILNKTLEDASRDNRVFLERSGCSTVQCLYDLPVDDVIKAVPWNIYPFWAMTDQGNLPVKGQFDGAMAIVDGYIIPHPPFEAWEMGKTIDVPLMIGTTGQEIDYQPSYNDLYNWTWSHYENVVTAKLGTFGLDVAKRALELYPMYNVTPEYQFTSLVSDIRVTCPNDILTMKAAKSFKSPVYRYVVTSAPSAPIHLFGLPFPARYSMHAWDMLAFFGTIGDYIAVQQSDKMFSDLVRREMLSFVHTGKPFTETWGTFGDSVAILNTTLSVAKYYHETECQYWMNAAKLWPYAWIN
ncbi:para-nitrobenzyl esterase-like [Saccostrea echinata]|uniref:para-nitrobenzyl esterase-like n=1 Tax=Saccostrea echinata TaxID=191078 RepID=UPI002A83AEFA|nr:para-nitrobenzyl esterase-like [Saccostrea echinata]